MKRHCSFLFDFIMMSGQLYHPDFDFMPPKRHLFFNSEQDIQFTIEQVY